MCFQDRGWHSEHANTGLLVGRGAAWGFWQRFSDEFCVGSKNSCCCLCVSMTDASRIYLFFLETFSLFWKDAGLNSARFQRLSPKTRIKKAQLRQHQLRIIECCWKEKSIQDLEPCPLCNQILFWWSESEDIKCLHHWSSVCFYPQC